MYSSIFVGVEVLNRQMDFVGKTRLCILFYLQYINTSANEWPC